MLRITKGVLVVSSIAFMCACQSPTDPDDPGTVDVDEFLDATVSPDPANAEPSVGRTYRVVRGNNQPDDILPYDWRTVFTVSLTMNSNATDDDVDIIFPVDITSATVKVEQAANGIIIPPTGGDVEHYEHSIPSVSSNRVSGVGSPVNMTFEVWYDLPNLLKEALVTVTVSFTDSDDDGKKSFSKVVKVRVAP